MIAVWLEDRDRVVAGRPKDFLSANIAANCDARERGNCRRENCVSVNYGNTAAQTEPGLVNSVDAKLQVRSGLIIELEESDTAKVCKNVAGKFQRVFGNVEIIDVVVTCAVAQSVVAFVKVE